MLALPIRHSSGVPPHRARRLGTALTGNFPQVVSGRGTQNYLCLYHCSPRKAHTPIFEAAVTLWETHEGSRTHGNQGGLGWGQMFALWAIVFLSLPIFYFYIKKNTSWNALNLFGCDTNVGHKDLGMFPGVQSLLMWSKNKETFCWKLI